MLDSAHMLAAEFAVHMPLVHVLNVLVKRGDRVRELNVVAWNQ